MNNIQDTVDPYGILIIFAITFVVMPGAWWLYGKLKKKDGDR